MHQQGWKLVKISWLFFYHFEKCQPEEVVYQVDFKESKIKTETPICVCTRIMDGSLSYPAKISMFLENLRRWESLNCMVIGKVRWSL
ncbi:TPA: DUF2812 domain-containing protein [Streptococcus suis]|nr:DUF2812 domain-containing protein [Streptococcus suis]HEL1748449.1 DUF2812 domain-containing protein [Streptococcus suis]HEL2065146.1 DUF2812 domain-containing protein [Streptococcus suis]HEM5086869.1 DUF2812 domain-containing protein [Streptococcus suis]HEM5243960.1 DUF2812 domain-containing protein [Streptococcus suis]